MEWKRGGGRDKETAGVWVRGRKGMWEQEGKDIESLTSACPILLPSSECAERKRKRETICVFPLLQTWLLTHKLRTVWDTQHSVVRELLASSSVQLCPPPLPWSSSTWYNPFKRLHVISVCTGSSLRAAAHSAFSSAGALTFFSACWAASLFSSVFFLSLYSLCILSCFLFLLCSPSFSFVCSAWPQSLFFMP